MQYSRRCLLINLFSKCQKKNSNRFNRQTTIDLCIFFSNLKIQCSFLRDNLSLNMVVKRERMKKSTWCIR